MAKNLILVYQDIEYSSELIKIDRKEIYGSLTYSFVSNNSEYKFTSLTDNGLPTIPRGANLLTENRITYFCDNLLPLNFQGNLLSKFASSFEPKIKLSEHDSIEWYLSLNVTSIYQLKFKSIDTLNLLSQNIYKFSFNYREGYEPNDAFWVFNEKDIFMVVGFIANFEYLGLENIQPDLIGNEETEENLEIDMDF